MTKIGDKKLAFKDIPKLYRIPISCCEEHCYLNVGRNSVVKVFEQKPLHTWTLTHPNYFTCPVVYCNENLYCVINSNILIKWSVNEDSLKNAEKIKFQEPIFTVIAMSEKQPLVLLKSGNYAVVDGPHPIKVTPALEKKEIIWADVSAAGGLTKLFSLVCDDEKTAYTLHCQKLNSEDNFETVLTPLVLGNEKLALQTWCLNRYNSSFLTIWSNGMVYLHQDNNPKSVKMLHLKEVESCESVAATFLDVNHLGIAYFSNNLREIVLEIWDTKYCVLKTRKSLRVPCVENLQILSERSFIFLYFNKEISSYPVSLEPSSLLAAVGKSPPEATQVLEFSWENKGQLVKYPSSSNPEAMDIVEKHEKSTDSIEDIAQRLLSKNSQFLMYIPESELAKLLKISISHFKGDKNDRVKDAVTNILNTVFSASFNDIYLMKYLKRINLEDTLITLELLLAYFNEPVETSENITTERPTSSQVINWTFLLIQSHMEALLLSKDKQTKTLLRKIEKAMSLKAEEYEDCENIRNYFLILKKKQLLPEPCSRGKYFIDSLDI